MRILDSEFRIRGFWYIAACVWECWGAGHSLCKEAVAIFSEALATTSATVAAAAAAGLLPLLLPKVGTYCP